VEVVAGNQPLLARRLPGRDATERLCQGYIGRYLKSLGREEGVAGEVTADKSGSN
jgi:hypothetical protein